MADPSLEEGWTVPRGRASNYRCTKDFGSHSTMCRTRWNNYFLNWFGTPANRLRPQHFCRPENSTDQQIAISDNKWLQRMPFSPGVPPNFCIPTKCLILAFINWVHRHNAVVPALISHRPSASSKFSICLCYERHLERTMGVTLRGTLRHNCLTIQGQAMLNYFPII